MKVAVIIPDADALDPKLRELVKASVLQALESFEKNAAKVDKQYREGRLGESINHSWFVDQNPRSGDL